MYENVYQRFYNEVETNSYEILYSETQIKLIELVEKYDFKIFYINCKPKSKLKLFFGKSEYVSLNNKEVMLTKKMLSEDLYYLYKNKLFEVIYTIPKINEQDNYYFNMLLVVNNNFDLNLLYNYNFNIIKINSVQQILKKI